ncbi:hypothetical protein [Nocardiopsis sp. LOL_012]|uniref:hypothetical protein n=1 Tax=Nocardiopsis sp. LOL_012 TaxID=3345409 RepID=UPI003A87CA4C
MPEGDLLAAPPSPPPDDLADLTTAIRTYLHVTGRASACWPERRGRRTQPPSAAI